MDTYLHIDYLALTFNWTLFEPQTPADNEYAGDYFGRKVYNLLFNYPSFRHHNWKGVHYETNGGAGFKHRHYFETNGWSFFWGAKHNRLLIQFGGEACHALRMDTDEHGNSVGLKPLFLIPDVRMTRIDIAGNWRCEFTPQSVAKMFSKKDYEKMSVIPTETGTTVYIGSKQSELSAKVYRYAPPHPRHEWLRVEFTLMGEKSRDAMVKIPQHGLLPIYTSLLREWGFTNEPMISDLGVGVEAVKLAYKRRQNAGSTRWLYRSALPSVRKALQDGTLDRDELLRYLGITDDTGGQG